MNPDQTVAEDVPRAFRAILDGVGRLEQLDAWQEATRLRAQAIAAYAKRWDQACLRSLERILARAEAAGREAARREAARRTRDQRPSRIA